MLSNDFLPFQQDTYLLFFFYFMTWPLQRPAGASSQDAELPPGPGLSWSSASGAADEHPLHGSSVQQGVTGVSRQEQRGGLGGAGRRRSGWMVVEGDEKSWSSFLFLTPVEEGCVTHLLSRTVACSCESLAFPLHLNWDGDRLPTSRF